MGNFDLGVRMFSHPSAIIGYILAAIGWFFLFTGGATDVGYGARAVVNFHTLWIATGLILSGGLLIVAGVVAGGFQRITIYLAGNPEMKAAFDAHLRAQAQAREQMQAVGAPYAPKGAPTATTDASIDDPDAEKLRRAAQSRGINI